MCTTLSERTVTCRKAHPCIWCPERIEIGETAFSYAGIFEGDFTSWHMHPECYDAFIDEMTARGESCMEIDAHAQERGKDRTHHG